ncbi:MAG: carbohydrate ABC transporter substrate-binding protein [Oscillospiraceae bacterium]|nr:carbohydrate ABC transporter substrate-binding protein [Oscillospiraceae bacterium]
MKRFITVLLVLVMALSMAACASTQEDDAASVYFLNFKPEADAAWQELAALYTEQTGVEVKVVTAAGGNYSDTLTAEMAKSECPTLFQCGNAQTLKDWDAYCLDLTGSEIVAQMTTDDFNLYNEEGQLKAFGYCYEAFGIIVNKALLAEAGYSVEDITNFETLKAVAEDIHARADELGFDAFSSSGLDSSSSWRFSGHLANMPLYYEFRDDGITTQPAEIKGTYLDAYKNIWDLYINNTTMEAASLTTATGDMSTSEFKEGKAVFYQNGTWEYAGLVEAGMNPEDLQMIPIYCGVEGEEEAGLACGTENCWAINANASEADIQATIDFVLWVVTSEEGTTMMAKEFGPIPFKNAKESENVFFNDANKYMADGKYTVTWAFNHTPNVEAWRATVVTALATYATEQSDANWAAVEDAFVNGWALEYSIQNGG